MWVLIIVLHLYSGATSGGTYGAVHEINGFTVKSLCMEAKKQVESINAGSSLRKVSAVCVYKI